MYDTKQDDYFSAARSVVVEFIATPVERVLEIGCGSGETLALLKKTKICDETVGIELVESAAARARENVDRVYWMDVETSPLPAELGRFNVILLLDVLEHLVDPWTFLKSIADQHLSRDGSVIISLPNARHFSLTFPLLFGRFEYVERGIRDKTHLRFFTKKSAIAMIESAGLQIQKMKPTSLDWTLNSGKLNLLTLGAFSGFLASQYVFGCTRLQSEHS